MEKKVVVTDRQVFFSQNKYHHSRSIYVCVKYSVVAHACVCIMTENQIQKLFLLVQCSLFSMDGDFAPLPQLVELRRKYGFLLVIDDVSNFISPKINLGRLC
jgi:7-keto-8-aminopelargonate synthetase-like enzyme